MYPRPIKAQAIENYNVLIEFTNGEKKVFDMNEKIKTPFYQTLQDLKIFNTVEAKDITIEWSTGQDISPEDLYLNSKNI